MKRYDTDVCEKVYFLLKLGDRSSLQIAKARSRENVISMYFQVACGVRILVFCKFVLNNAISTYIDISEVILIIDRHPCIDDILDTGVSMTFLVSRLLSVPI